jgi:hypothetical protein
MKYYEAARTRIYYLHLQAKLNKLRHAKIVFAAYQTAATFTTKLLKCMHKVSDGRVTMMQV